jgi:hypothetical protein
MTRNLARHTHRLAVLTGVILLVSLMGIVYPPGPVHASHLATPVGPFQWSVEFFGNADLSGSPAFTWQQYFVGGNWGTGSPGPGVPVNYFSARWSTNANLTGGTYRLTFVADDCVRLYVDNQVKLNTFDQPRPGETLSVQLSLGAGNHWVQIEFRENTKTAYLFFTWELLAVAPPTPGPAPTSAPPSPTPGPPVGWVNTTGLNVHSGPDYSNSVILLAFQNWQMTLLGRNATSTWLKVQAPDGKIGWVETSHITTSYPIARLPIADGTQPVQPVKTITTVVTSGYPEGVRTHVVQRGETLFRIALRYGVDMYTLARVNGIVNLNLIFAGQVLVIP